MIIDITNPVLIPQILEMAEKIDKMEVEALEGMLTEGLARVDAKILLEKKDEQPRGFLYATVDYFNGEEVVFIQCCYIEPSAPQAGHELMNKIRDWGREQGLENIYFLTKRNAKAFQRKYGFENAYAVLKRRI